MKTEYLNKRINELDSRISEFEELKTIGRLTPFGCEMLANFKAIKKCLIEPDDISEPNDIYKTVLNPRTDSRFYIVKREPFGNLPNIKEAFVIFDKTNTDFQFTINEHEKYIATEILEDFEKVNWSDHETMEETRTKWEKRLDLVNDLDSQLQLLMKAGINDKDDDSNYRLEFNEDQQHFHLDDYSHKENTNGWFTVSDSITFIEFQIFESFVMRKKKDKLTKSYLLKCKSELKIFIKNLKNYNLKIEEL